MTTSEKIDLRMTGGAPWGFRLQGGGRLSLVVHKVRPKSKCQGHLREGDVIVTVNGQDCENMTYDDVMNVVENCGNELSVQVIREVYKEKLPPSEIARLEGTLKKPRRNMSNATEAECYERSFKTPDGFNVKETKIFQSSQTQSNLQESGETFGPVAAFAKVQRLPEDVIKRSSLSKSPDFTRSTNERVEVTETRTTSKQERFGDVKSPFFSIEKEPITQPVKEVNIAKEPKLEFYPGQNEIEQNGYTVTRTTKIHERVGDSAVLRKEEKVTEEVVKEPKPDTKVIRNEPAPTSQAKSEPKFESFPAQTEIKQNGYTIMRTTKIHESVGDSGIITKEEKVTEEVINEPKSQLEESTPMTSQSKLQQNFTEDVKLEIPGAKVLGVDLNDAEEKKWENFQETRSGVTPTVTKNEPRHPQEETKEEMEGRLPKREEHVTSFAKDVADETLGSSSATKMPGVTQKHSAPLFRVSKFLSETESSYVWSPTASKSQEHQKYGSHSNQRHSGIYESRPAPPPPPPPPPRPLSVPDFDHFKHLKNFTDQVRQEVCTEERRNAAEKDNRRSASLEMIKKALVPPSEEELKETLITKTKKKMFSSSSFYEEPNAIYPTVEEQFDLAQKIANSLSSENNRKSKGADMFIKRVNKSTKWVHESPNRDIPMTSETTTYSTNITSNKSMSPSVGRSSQPQTNGSESESELSMRQSKLKPVLNPIRPQDSQMFVGTDREFKAQGLALSPYVCANLVQDLNNSKGKGATIFANRRKKSEKWIVDDSKLPAPQAPPVAPKAPKEVPQNRLKSMISDNNWNQQRIRYVQSPWEAALASPYGSCEAAFEVTNYKKNYPKLPPAPCEVIKARLPSMLNIEKQEFNAPVTARSGLYKPKAPRGWARSVHDPTSSELLGAPSDLENYPVSDSEGMKSSSRQFGNYNTLPRSWGRQQKDSSSYRPVRASLYSFT